MNHSKKRHDDTEFISAEKALGIHLKAMQQRYHDLQCVLRHAAAGLEANHLHPAAPAVFSAVERVAPGWRRRDAVHKTTDAGTVEYATTFVRNAKSDLEPFIKDLDQRTQIQIIVDYVRAGQDRFWSNVRKNRSLDDSQPAAWRESPGMFIDRPGTHPMKLAPDLTKVSTRQLDQIEQWLKE